MLPIEAERIEIGDTVYMTEEQAMDNYGEEYVGMPLTVSHIATSQEEHPGFDGQTGSYLFDFEELPFSLYEWEIEFEY